MFLCRLCGNTFDADRKSSYIRMTPKAIPPGRLPVFGKAPRRIFVYIAAILVYKATDTIADTEQGESRFARALKSAMTEMKRSLSA